MTLRTEIQTDPLGLGYAAFLPDCPGLIADMLNSQTRTAAQTHIISERGVLDKYAAGPMAADVVLSKLEVFAKAGSPLSSLVARAMKFLGTDAGLDLGSPTTRGMLDALASAGVITASESSNLKTLAMQPCSRAQELGIPQVSALDVTKAMQ